MSKIDVQYRKAFADYSNRPYAEQSKLFMNAFWEDIQNNAEEIWKFTQKFIELDQKLHAGGHDLDEFEAHKFLESLGETMTVMALRERLRTIDLDSNNRMSMCEYLVFKYKKTVKDFVETPQGDNSKEIKEAQEKVDAASSALQHAEQALEESKKANQELEKQLRESQEAQVKLEQQLEQQKKALEEQKRLEEEVKKAEAENKAALDELHRQEEEYNRKINDLTAKSTDSSASTVQKSKAANELQQLKGEDPLPLRKAKINQGATVRKCEKAAKDAQNQTAIVEQKTKEVEQATLKQQEKVKQVEAAKKDAEEKEKESEKAAQIANAKFQEAVNFLEEIRSRPGSSKGTIWYMNRELTEKKKYLPKSKQ